MFALWYLYYSYKELNRVDGRHARNINEPSSLPGLKETFPSTPQIPKPKATTPSKTISSADTLSVKNTQKLPEPSEKPPQQRHIEITPKPQSPPSIPQPKPQTPPPIPQPKPQSPPSTPQTKPQSLSSIPQPNSQTPSSTLQPKPQSSPSIPQPTPSQTPPPIPQPKPQQIQPKPQADQQLPQSASPPTNKKQQNVLENPEDLLLDSQLRTPTPRQPILNMEDRLLDPNVYRQRT